MSSNEPSEGQPLLARGAFRSVGAIFGLVLIAVGCYLLFFADTSGIGRLVGGAVLVLVGGNAVYSSARSRESWLSKIGPLP